MRGDRMKGANMNNIIADHPAHECSRTDPDGYCGFWLHPRCESRKGNSCGCDMREIHGLARMPVADRENWLEALRDHLDR